MESKIGGSIGSGLSSRCIAISATEAAGLVEAARGPVEALGGSPPWSLSRDGQDSHEESGAEYRASCRSEIEPYSAFTEDGGANGSWAGPRLLEPMTSSPTVSSGG